MMCDINTLYMVCDINTLYMMCDINTLYVMCDINTLYKIMNEVPRQVALQATVDQKDKSHKMLKILAVWCW